MTLAKEIQDSVAGYVQTLGALRSAPVVGRRKAVLEREIQEQLEAAGLVVYVFPGLPVEVNQNNPGPYVDRLEVRVRVIELPETNRDYPDAYEAVEILLAALHLWEPVTSRGAGNALVCRPAPVEEVPDTSGVAFDLLFDLSVGVTLRADVSG